MPCYVTRPAKKQSSQPHEGTSASGSGPDRAGFTPISGPDRAGVAEGGARIGLCVDSAAPLTAVTWAWPSWLGVPDRTLRDIMGGGGENEDARGAQPELRAIHMSGAAYGQRRQISRIFIPSCGQCLTYRIHGCRGLSEAFSA